MLLMGLAMNEYMPDPVRSAKYRSLLKVNSKQMGKAPTGYRDKMALSHGNTVNRE